MKSAEMPAESACNRCKEKSAPFEGELPLPKDLAKLVRDAVCAACWREWQEMEVIVINELRLNFMDPASQEILHRRMKEFFELEATTE